MADIFQGYGHHARRMFSTDSFDSMPLRRDNDYNNSSGYTPLFLAVHRGNLNLTHSLLQENSEREEIQGRMLIHIASAKGYEKIVRLLLERNACIDKGDRDGNTPLHLAVRGNHIAAFNLLLNANVVNVKNLHAETPLYIATLKSHTLFVELLLKNGANVNGQDARGKTPLHIAVQKKKPNLQVISLLLTYGASGNILCHAKLTPLVLAIHKSNPEIIKCFIKHNRKVEIAGVNQMTPLHHAAQYGNEEIVKLLLTNGYGNVNDKNENFRTPLYYAAANGHLEVLEYLLDNGSVIESAASDKESLLHLCTINGRIDILKCLINHGAQLDVKTWKGETLLHLAAANGDLNVLKFFIKNGADISAETFKGETPLYLAVQEGHDEIVEELLKNGADVNSLGAKKISALVLAVKSRNKKIVQLLLDKDDKREFLISQYEFSTEQKVLHIAAGNGDDEILKILLKAGCPSNVIWRGQNALHVAAKFGDTKSVKTLIEAGVDINSKTKFSETPLHFATVAGQSSVVKFLLDVGADRTGAVLRFLSHYTLNKKRKDAAKLKRNICSAMIGNVNFFSEDITLDSEWKISPLMFEKYLEVLEMLLIRSDFDEIRRSFAHILEYACQIRVLDDTLHIATKVVFRPEIVRCILNYLNETFIITAFESMIQIANKFKISQLIDVFLEYDVQKLYRDIEINCSINNTESVLVLIDHVEDINFLLTLLYTSNVQKEVRVFCNSSFKIVESMSIVNFNSNLVLKKDNYMDILKLLVARLVQLRSVSKVSIILDSKELEILENYGLNDWYTQCEVQIMEMRETTIYHKYDINYYDILTKPVNKIVNFVRCEDLLNILKSSYAKFPAYSAFLERSVEKGMQRKCAIDSSANCLSNIVNTNFKVELPSLVINKIFEYLSIIDLRKLSSARRFDTALY